jgi:SAM-dependent methyltransferase
VAVTEIDRDALARLAADGIVGKTPDAAMRDGFDRPFDAVTCWHVLEHIERPAELARWVRRQLKPDGVFVVTVPNVASWQAKASGRAWMHLDPPRHRYHFNPTNLRRLLNEAGFDVVRETTFAAEYDVFGVAQSALNRVTARPNVWFELLTNRGASNADPRGAAPARDRVLSYALGVPLVAAAGPLSLAAWAAGAGATLTFTCRPRIGNP